MKQRLLVVGSVNYDLMFRHERLPGPGESLLGATFYESCGGKGANQAVVAGRVARILSSLNSGELSFGELGSRELGSGNSGVEVSFAGVVGRDVFGDKQRQVLVDAGVDVEHLITLDGVPTGTSSVWIETTTGQNRILSSGGANERFTPELVAGLPIESASLILMPNEIPAPTLAAVAERAYAAEVPVLWNPAPFAEEEVPAIALNKYHFVTPNEVEAAAMVGKPVDVQSAPEAARELVRLGAKVGIVTLGEAGVAVQEGGRAYCLPAPSVEVVDTTGAGDALSGAFAAAYLHGMGTEQALRFALAYASESVCHEGTQSAYPKEFKHQKRRNV